MKKEIFIFQGCHGAQLPAIIWRPEIEAKGILQITHGMTEHMERYENFAAEMCRNGIAVAGFDLRGHGKNPGNPQVAAFGETGWEDSLQDMKAFRQIIVQQFPDLPLMMLGFSLGSFLLREYIGKYPDDCTAAVVMGTGHQPGWLLSFMIAIVNGQVKKVGADNTTDLVKQLSFGTYNQKFKPNRTEADWLCSNQEELNKYLQDTMVRKNISAGLFRDLLVAMKRTGKISTYETWNKKMPVLLISGQDDPVGDRGKGVRRVYQQMSRAGLENVELRLIADCRHDVFHEDKQSVSELCAFTTNWILEKTK